MYKCCTMFNFNGGYCRVYTIQHLVERRIMEEERNMRMSVNDIFLVSKHNFCRDFVLQNNFSPDLPPRNKIFVALDERYV